MAVVSLGEKGCVAKDETGGTGSSPACQVEVIDTVGAGDCFTAGFLFAYLRGASMQVNLH